MRDSLKIQTIFCVRCYAAEAFPVLWEKEQSEDPAGQGRLQRYTSHAEKVVSFFK